MKSKKKTICHEKRKIKKQYEIKIDEKLNEE